MTGPGILQFSPRCINMSKATFNNILRILIPLGPVLSALYRAAILVLRESTHRRLTEELLEICLSALQMIMKNPLW